MLRSAEVLDLPAERSSEAAETATLGLTHTAAATVYGLPFWLTYVANTSLMIAISLLFRYADFITYLGGSEFQLGMIVGSGMIGSLLMRLAQGVGIDRYGPRQIWLLSLVLFVLSLLGHLWVTRVDSPAIYALQILFRTSIAGAFGASITSIFHRVPKNRMAEAVGALGSSGFVGMVVGPQIGDLLLGSGGVTAHGLRAMFITAMGLGAVSFASAYFATKGDRPPRRRRKAPPLVWVLKRYHPGAMLLMGVAMGFGIGLPGVFLRTYAAELGLAKIGLFFSVYSSCAFTTRIATRRLTDHMGSRPMILIGMSSLVAALVLYLTVSLQWHLIVPALFTGIAHALLFPAIVAGGSGVFPSRYRGVGTALMLAMFDAGTLIGAPTIGVVLVASERAGLRPYPTMFVFVSSLLAVATLYYAMLSRKAPAKYIRKVRQAADGVSTHP